MFAAVLHQAKDLRIEDREPPSLAPGEVKVRFRAGGICGSDLAYYSKGKTGDFHLREPLILGHEMAGEVAEVAPDVEGLAVGQPVAVNPSRSCGRCDYCMAGLENQCLNMRFLGSASIFPHMQGAFREYLTVPARQCVPVPDHVSFAEASMAEPLAVSLHAVRRAGPLLGEEVLIVGCGPIGALVLLVARQAGARRITVVDLAEKARETALGLGADEAVDAKDEEQIAAWSRNRGRFGVVIEASGAPAGLDTALRAARARGRVVQLGNMPAGQSPVSVNLVMSKELEYRGSFRFAEEYALAVEMIAGRRIDLKPLMTHRFPVREADQAFQVALDRNQSMKVHLLDL